MAWQQIGNLRGPVGAAGAQGVAGPAGVGQIGPPGQKGDTGPPGNTCTIIGSFTNRAIAELPPDGYIPADWDAPGSPPAGNQLANGQGLLHTPTQMVCLWVGPTLTPSGWVELGDVQGPPGPMGPSGPIGRKGDPGDVGIQGEMGPVGPIGPIGIGIKGDKGDVGTTGATGGIGPQGAVGLTGAPGAVGPPGPNSVSADAGNLAKLGTDNLLLVPASAVHLGTVAADQAGAGNIGEQLAASQTSAVTLTTGTTANVATLALTPGDWVVAGVIVFAEAANTVPTMFAAAISLTSATLPTAAQIAAGNANMTQYNATFTKGVVSQTMQTGPTRVNASANTNVFLVAQAAFSTAGLTATGYVSARRVR